jgi:CheY-like chemotaxis protein
MGADTAENRTVLVVEDDADIRDCYATVLESRYNVLTASNGREALNLLAKIPDKPCIIFLDLMMPVMSGWDFLEEATETGILAGIRVVITTAANASKLPKQFELLPKPFDLRVLEKYCEDSCGC